MPQNRNFVSFIHQPDAQLQYNGVPTFTDRQNLIICKLDRKALAYKISLQSETRS